MCGEKLAAALTVPEKMKRKDARKAVKDEVKEALAADPDYAEDPSPLAQLGDIFAALEKKIVRRRIKEQGLRIDGRDTKTRAPHNH